MHRSLASLVLALALTACGRDVPSPHFNAPAETIEFPAHSLNGGFDLGDENMESWHPSGCSWGYGADVRASPGSSENMLAITTADCVVTSSPIPIVSSTTKANIIMGEFQALETGCSDQSCVAILLRQYDAQRRLLSDAICYAGVPTPLHWTPLSCALPAPGATSGYFTISIMASPAPVVPVAFRRLYDGSQDEAYVSPSR